MKSSYTLAPTGMRMNRLLFKKEKVGAIFSIYTFQSFFPIPSLLGLASILTLCIFFLYFWQARRIAHKIATHNAVPIESLVYQLQEIPKQAEKKAFSTNR